MTRLQDLRYAARTLLKHPGFSALAVLALAVGIGSATAIFSVVNGVLLRPLPHRDPDRLMLVWEKAERIQLDVMWVSLPNFYDWRERNRVFEDLAVFGSGEAGLTGAGEPEQLSVAWATRNLFPLLGAQPALGRGFTAEEDPAGGPAAVLLGHGLWQRRFGSDRNVVGKTLKLDGEVFTIVGVMPRGFAFPELAEEPVEAWVTLARILPADPDWLRRDNHPGLTALGRLRAGATPADAKGDMERVARALREEHPENFDDGVTLVPLKEQLVGGARRPLLVLSGAVAFLLLIACANVAGLLLVRGSARSREMALRAALGASRARLVRQLLVESVLLAAIGGVAGLLLASLGVDALLAVSPESLPRAEDVGIDVRVLAFALGLSLAVGVLFGLVPSLQASRADVGEALKEGARTSAGGRRNRVRRLLVVAELSLALVLLIAAGLMVRSFQRLLDVDPGFDPENVLMTQIAPTAGDRGGERQANFYRDVLERVGGLPGVTAVGVATDPPLSGEGRQSGFRIQGELEPPPGVLAPLADIDVVSPGYFPAMGIPLRSGRNFSPSDRAGAPLVAIVDEAIARRFWRGRNPLGARIAVGADEEGKLVWREVVGVAGAVKSYGLDAQTRILVYLPFLQEQESTMTLAVRTREEPAALAPLLRREIWRIDPEQAVGDVRVLDDLLARSLSPRRLHTLLLGVFAAAALALAALGVYGVMAQAVTQRTHEIGIRIAVGASRADVLKLVLGQTLLLTVVGLGLGFAGAAGATRLLASLLYEVSATDPLTFGAVAVVLVCVALLASYLPARRAARVDPMVALRYE